ncbi:ROK family protein [Labrys okinawensis]|uniref:ROK family protein n=1 Tax=Labrys okinawensis TaxID=346911 RepID=UPI001FE186A1|nr:ROK family protein [Labrys okinawensis]
MPAEPEAIGIDIGGTNLRAARVAAGGEILQWFAERSVAEPVALVDRLVEMIGRLDNPHVDSVGIGVPGRVDALRGEVLSGGYVDLSSVPLASTLAQRTGKRIFVDNDCNMALVGEMAAGAARGTANVAMLTIGTGIGGAVALDGRVLRGQRSAGQFGHVTVDVGGLPCACGRRGCVETTSSGTALGRHIREAGLPADMTAGQLLGLRLEGDRRAEAVIRAWAEPLRAAIDSLVAAFDPALVLLGGGLGKAAALALQSVPALSAWYQCPVAAATLGDDAGVIGAALAGRREADPEKKAVP